MRFFIAAFATVVVLTAPVLAVPSPLSSVETFSGNTSGKYIVKFKPGVSRKAWIQKLGLDQAASVRPSIVSMSLSGSTSTLLDNAVASLTSAGIHVAVAAGNSNLDASTSSPARAPSAVTVGASTIADARASFSNFGPIIDVFAPGLNVLSSWIGSDTVGLPVLSARIYSNVISLNIQATNTISGTSMATPHVAGLIAYLIGKEGNLSPADMSTKLQAYSVKGALTGLSSTTVNDLAHNAL
ncbi:hypothetical protein GALMADRAFT_282499 [Galerina marginata CBS 339.88]|uniref:Peptidase S8/S53 domain-containing protein n=1 Tax=Galerina marginata (strain CBS 339.88) TaxID=685588 RepID=A0A067SFS9_GALM3|nr:hypothetical protein GALMADRAFT_282499 [Galerina marginata CBS 339.88]